MKDNNMPTIKEILDGMTTGQLDEMLDKELHTEPVNDDAIRMILDILREREKGCLPEITPELEIAWERYRSNSAKIWKKTSRAVSARRFVLRAASIAAVLVLLIVIIPRQAEAESFWDKLFRWTEDIVEFFSPKDNEDRLVEYEFKTDNPGLQQVYDSVAELGITVPVVPMWLPEGSELVECKIDDLPASKRLYSRFRYDKSDIIYCVDVYEVDVSHKYQKDETAIDSYEYGGINHHILRNFEMTVVVWSAKNIECSMFINCQEDTVLKILRSIYKQGG